MFYRPDSSLEMRTPISYKYNILAAIIVHHISFTDESSEQTIIALLPSLSKEL